MSITPKKRKNKKNLYVWYRPIHNIVIEKCRRVLPKGNEAVRYVPIPRRFIDARSYT